MWFGAEENGLIGSSYYAETLSQKEADKVDVMLDYDMLASANYIRGVYDGDGDDTEDGDPATESPESGKVEQVFDDWFRAQGQPVVKRWRSTAARTTSASRCAASRPAASSPAPRASRPLRKSRSSAAPRARGTTRATTRSATT